MKLVQNRTAIPQCYSVERTNCVCNPQWYGHSVRINTTEFTFILYPTLEHVDPHGYKVRGHLNIHVERVDITALQAERAGGVVGRTLAGAFEHHLAGSLDRPGRNEAQQQVCYRKDISSCMATIGSVYLGYKTRTQAHLAA